MFFFSTLCLVMLIKRVKTFLGFILHHDSNRYTVQPFVEFNETFLMNVSVMITQRLVVCRCRLAVWRPEKFYLCSRCWD